MGRPMMALRNVLAIVLAAAFWVTPAGAQNAANSGAAPAPQVPPTVPWMDFQWVANSAGQLPPAYANNPNANYAGMMFQWMNVMGNHFMGPAMDEATRFQVMDAMMRAADPRFMFGLTPTPGAEQQEKLDLVDLAKGEGTVPDRIPAIRVPGFPTQTLRNWKPNTVSESISTEAKRSMYQSMMLMSPLSMRDMISIMTDKLPVEEGVSFDDAVDSMKLRANEVNFKLVGHSPLWKDVRAITGDENTPRVEIFQFCDAVVARKILDYVPEFVIFIPCRIALLEDGEGKLWVMTMDWDINWLDYAQNPNSELDKELRADAQRIRNAMRYIMEGAATGDF